MAVPTVRPTMDGLRVREMPVDGKPIGQVYSLDTLESLESLEETRRKLGKEGEWLKVRTPEGVEGYVAAQYLKALNVPFPDPMPPTPALQPVVPVVESTPAPAAVEVVAEADAPLYVRPTMDGLRVRETPVDGHPIGQVATKHALQVLESAESARAKIGVEGQWMKIRTPDGLEGYIAAWYVDETEAPQIARARLIDGQVNILGMNLDQFHPLGTPAPERLGRLGWVRFGYNVSMGTGSQDLAKAYEAYAPLAERYANAGLKVMFTFTHQTYGEGVDEFWPWPNMTDDKWVRLTARYSDMLSQIAQQFAGKGLIHCWQIWNEQDAPIGAVASVPMSPRNYAHLLSESLQAVRAADASALVISGGHTRGPSEGSAYARETIRNMPQDVRPDGIAFHPYGRGPRANTRYANWGHIEEEIDAYTPILPDRPVWITEWGVLDKPNDPPAEIAQYAEEFMVYLNNFHKGKVAAALWYAWAMSMHNGYGLVDAGDRPLQPLHDRFLALHFTR